jgi:hypothetical protein
MLVLGTQQHLVNNPSFLGHVVQQTRAANPLLLNDESEVLLRSTEGAVTAADLDRFIEAQEAHLAGQEDPSQRAKAWLDHSRILRLAKTEDLREAWSFPRIDAHWAKGVQERGQDLFGTDFRFVAFELMQLGRSDPAGRERLPSGDIRYAALPYLGARFIVFSGSMSGDLARFRLDPDHALPAVASPYAGHRFEHPRTTWYNLRTMEGAGRFFPTNAGRLLDFFAAKVARNIEQGQRTLLVSRKCFVDLCARGLRRRLQELDAGAVTIATGDWGRHDLEDPRVVALINYGVRGVNRFEHVEAAYCLNSYFIPPAAVEQAVQDIEASPHRYPISIRTEGEPRRRRVVVALPAGVEPITARIAQMVLEQKEADVIVQAVGRVRPFTRPREVISFHCGELPGVRYTADFSSLAQARSWFGVRTAGQGEREQRRQQAIVLQASGVGVKAIAEQLGVSESTVKRDLRG